MTAATLHHKPATSSDAPTSRLAGMFVVFETPGALVAACRRMREAGFTKFDAHSPFPIHGIDDAIGIRPTRLPWFTLAAGLTGFCTALLMQWWMNAVAYPFLISGKPLFSVPASWPVTFELTVLFSAYTTVIAMVLLNGLPRFSNPFLYHPEFQRTTNDRFALAVTTKDPRFRDAETEAFLHNLEGGTVHRVYDDLASAKYPLPLIFGALMLLSCLLIPPVLIVKARVTAKSVPKWHFIWDMDFQPKFKTQRENDFFADLRAMRPPVQGTIARGELEADDAFYRGLESADEATLQAALVSFQQAADAENATNAPADGANAAPPADGNVPAGPEDPLDKLPWVKTFPLPVSGQLMKRGQERYDIYCATCHGLVGDGDGLITQRALELQQGTWIKPVSYHSEAVRNQPIGRLFNTITHGVRKMPAMGDIIPPEDRWAILLYLRALQRSRNATLNDVPASVVPELKDVP